VIVAGQDRRGRHLRNRNLRAVQRIRRGLLLDCADRVGELDRRRRGRRRGGRGAILGGRWRRGGLLARNFPSTASAAGLRSSSSVIAILKVPHDHATLAPTSSERIFEVTVEAAWPQSQF